MRITKPMQKTFAILITLLLSVTSLASTFFWNHKPPSTLANAATNQTNKNPVSTTHQFFHQNHDDLVTTLQKNAIINIDANARYQKIHHKLDNFHQINSVIDYHEQNHKIINYLNHKQLKPVLAKMIKQAIYKLKPYKDNQDFFSGKIYYNTNNLNQQIQVLVVWKNRFIPSQYYDFFQIQWKNKN